MDIVNIVATGDLGTNINLNDLSLTLTDDFRYEPESYHCGYLTVDDKSISIFSSGKYIMLGLKDLDEVNKLYSKMINILDRLNINVKNSKPPKISNIVLHDDFGDKLDLSNLAIYLGLEQVTYEPETFPGLIYRNKRTFNIYNSGKILAFGNNLKELKKDLNDLKKELDQFV